MIKTIIGKDIKGLSFETKIGKKTLILGDNGTGKSTRTQALTLAILGYIPGAQKTNAEIYETFGKESIPLVVGFIADNDTRFERGFGTIKSGSVSQGFKINGTKVNEEEYMLRKGECGSPRILDLSTFLKLSDQKKIDMVFSLYPPSEDITGLDSIIETQKKNILKLEDQARKTEDAAATLAAKRAAKALPAGTLAEIDDEIVKKEEMLIAAEKELKDIEIDEATVQAGEAARKKVEDIEKKALKEKEKKDAEEKEKRTAEEAAKKEPAKEEPKKEQNVQQPGQEPALTPKPEWIPPRVFAEDVFKAFDRVVKCMEDSGCTVCAARLIVRREVAKIRSEI